VDEPPRRAAFARVDFDLKGFSDAEIQMLGHLAEAVALMNPIYRDQYEPLTTKLIRFVQKLSGVANAQQKAAIKDYLTLIDLQNSPYTLLPRKNTVIGLPEVEVKDLVKKAGIEANYPKLAPFLFEKLPVPDRAGFYPPDMNDEDWKQLGDDANVVNSSVYRDNGRVRIKLNEVKYRATLEPVIEHLKAARELSPHPEFRIYLDSKIEELRHGTTESRRLADFMYIRHGYKIDVVISTALEVYMDNWKNARGEAAGAVYVENVEAQSLLAALVERLPEWEHTAPWNHRKMEIDKATLPRLRFVDVLSWTGDYVNSPMTIIAQSLPNDDWVVSKIGSVNLVYRNTGKAVHKMSGNLSAQEFMPKAAVEKYGSLLFEATQIHSALHELGHTTGAMDPEHKTKQARDYLENEYSSLEEARAELFAMWALPRAAKAGIISKETADAGQYGMLISMVGGLRFLPEQAHNKARNLMYHYFLAHGGIKQVKENGTTKFDLDLSQLDQQVSDLLGMLGNLKAAGDKAGAATLREQWCFVDPMKEEIDQRSAILPLGRGLIFPSLKMENGKYVPVLEYPAEFSNQEKFKAELIEK
jgi:hypothetical protein